MTQTVLILGASGRFGRQAAAAFKTAGWTVRGFDRARDRLETAVVGVDVIVAGWNPAYPDWAKQVPQIHASIIAAAKASDATVIVPGNVYVFGDTTPTPWSENSSHNATNALGRIRIEMEAAYRASGVKTIVLRAGDFIDTRASGNWFDAMMARKVRKGKFSYPGPLDRIHTWAYLPDLARAAVMLAEMRDLLPRFLDVPFQGYTVTGAQMGDAVQTAAGFPVKASQMSWLPLQIAKPFWPLGRCLLEMRYLWKTPHQLDGKKLAELLPDFKQTPLVDALKTALPQ